MVIVMLIISLIVGAVFSLILYNASTKREEQQLDSLVKNNVQMIEAMIRSHLLHINNASAPDAVPAILRNALGAHIENITFGESGEFMLGTRSGENIVFLTKLRKTTTGENPAIPWHNHLSTPMRRAISGESGISTGIDYRGESVLAAFTPIRGTSWGAVVKIDLAEIRKPFIRAMLLGAAISIVIIFAGAVLLKRIGDPILRQLQKLWLAVEQSASLIMITDAAGGIEYVNPTFTEITGYTIGEIAGRQPALFKSGQTTNEEYAALWRTILEGHKWRGEFCNRKKSGDLFWVWTSIIPLKDDDGRITHFLTIQEDITELKRIQYELTRSNTELEHFAYIVSHDLQEPLRMVASYTQLLARRYTDRLDQTANEFIEFAVNGANRMQMLIDNLLQYARIARTDQKFEKVDLNSVLEDVKTNLKLAIEESRAEIFSENLPVVNADKPQISRLFQNLISNAIKFRGDRTPLVKIEAQKRGYEWLFSVEDNGIGMESTDKIFVIFQRSKNSEKYPGSGIGLAVCKKIVERHGGKIWVESVPDHGSKFYFTLPEKT